MRTYWLFAFIILAGCNSRRASDDTTLMPDSIETSNRLVVMPDSVANYIDAALDSMQQYSIRKRYIDWPKLRKTTFEKAKGATTYQQTYPAIQEALIALGDQHSFFITPEQHQQWLGKGNPDTTKNKDLIGLIRDEKFALIYVHTFTSGNPEQILNYASDLQAKIKELDALNPIGWIVDLSYNSGGNMWPMLAGIGPLLDEGVLGSFLSADGNRITWRYEKGEVKAGSEVLLKIPNPYKIKNKHAPVALFVSERTASSGEAVLVSFMGRTNTRIFGTPTAGLSTANQNLTLVDGAQLILTSAVFTDRTGKIYGKQIVPNVDLSEKWYFITGFEFHIMKGEAEEWITKVNENMQSGSENKSIE